jgi:hypothetical protein
MELLAICAVIDGSKYNIFDIYIPPASATNNYSSDFDGIFILGTLMHMVQNRFPPSVTLVVTHWLHL